MKTKANAPLWRVTVRTNSAAEDAVAEFLGTHFGVATAAYFDLEKNWSEVSAFLESSPRRPFPVAATKKAVAAGLLQLAACGLPTQNDTVEVKRVRREDWAESWKRHFHPLVIGRKLLIKPSWSRRWPVAGQAVVTLDPGLSFGTGQHPTTEFCLGQVVACRHPDMAQSFLDIGTGSGILALAAARMGYRPVHGFDFDPQAVSVARANRRVNELDHLVRIHAGDVYQLSRRPARKYDLVAANLIANVLLEARPQIVAQMKPGGTLVLAGILATEFGVIERAYRKSGLKLVAREVKNEWCSGAFCFA